MHVRRRVLWARLGLIRESNEIRGVGALMDVWWGQHLNEERL